MDYDRIRQTFERLNRSGVLEMANRLSAQHKERITEMQKQPLAMVAAAHQKRMERILESFTMPSVSPEAYRTANSIAAQALRVSERSRLRAINAINAGQFDNIIQRASALASAPYTQELLRRANEVITTPPSANHRSLIVPFSSVLASSRPEAK